jgi:hypothetical protein
VRTILDVDRHAARRRGHTLDRKAS